MRNSPVVFVVNLLQDVNVLRPLIFLVALDFARPTTLLVTAQFRKRDASGVWQRELGAIADQAGAAIADFADEFEALTQLPQGPGYIVAASESNLNAHKQVHDLFRVVPAGWLRITLQHGFECVGFLQSREQNLAHGPSIRFAADVICGWCEPDQLKSLAPSQRHKLQVTGPTSVLQQPAPGEPPLGMGLVCENLHSPRLNVAGNFKQDFLRVFEEYCQALAEGGQRVTLRPHPGGQYVIKNKVELPANVLLENRPIYQVDLRRFAYGISAPSSVVIDMLLADIPVAVWQDDGGMMDLGNYEGLTRVTTVGDWLEFAREASERPERFLARQREFLRLQKMLIEPVQVHGRYAALLHSLQPAAMPRRLTELGRERILYVANGWLPTLQLSFIKPLAPLVESGEFAHELLTEEDLLRQLGSQASGALGRDRIVDRFTEFKPTLIVFCRYSGPHSEWILQCARQAGIPTIYHIDDDLLNIPEDIGSKKHAFHNRPERLTSVRCLLDGVDLIYCSTANLRSALLDLGIATPIYVGEIYCSGEIINSAARRPVLKIGYMASADHAHNLGVIGDALVRVMRAHPSVSLEFFGSITPPKEFAEFSGRIIQAPPISDYGSFLQSFAERQWDIGICPLTPIHFNLMKANTKWVEYTAVGAAVVASRDTVYDRCCSAGCGTLASTASEWFTALDTLIRNPDVCYEQVRLAQQRLVEQYSVDRLRDQVLNVFARVRSTRNAAVKDRLESVK